MTTRRPRTVTTIIVTVALALVLGTGLLLYGPWFAVTVTTCALLVHLRLRLARDNPPPPRPFLTGAEVGRLLIASATAGQITVGRITERDAHGYASKVEWTHPGDLITKDCGTVAEDVGRGAAELGEGKKGTEPFWPFGDSWPGPHHGCATPHPHTHARSQPGPTPA